MTCGICHGAGEIQAGTAFVPRSGDDRARIPTCHGVGEVISDPCGKCGGDGRVKSRRTMTVKIPAGVEAGMQVQLSVRGESGPVAVLPATCTSRSPRSVTTCSSVTTGRPRTITVPIADAALGGEVTVESILGDPVTITIPQNTSPAT